MIQRTVRDVVADTVVAMISGGMLDNSRTTIVRACTVLGLGRDDLDRAARRSHLGDGLASVPFAAITIDPHHVPQVEPEPEPEPEVEQDGDEADRPARVKRPYPVSRLRPNRKGPHGEPLLQCTGCRKWMPTDQYRERADRPGFYSSRCVPCRQKYQRARHVKVATLDALERVDIKFVLDDESNLIGLACTKCGVALASGDTAVASVGLAHAHCPPPPACHTS